MQTAYTRFRIFLLASFPKIEWIFFLGRPKNRTQCAKYCNDTFFKIKIYSDAKCNSVTVTELKAHIITLIFPGTISTSWFTADSVGSVILILPLKRIEFEAIVNNDDIGSKAEVPKRPNI